MFFEMDEFRADKNWAHFYKIKGLKNWELSKNVSSNSHSPSPIFLRENTFLKNQANF